MLILSKIGQYAADPASLANNVKRLKNREASRLRVGDWRIVFLEDATTIVVERIAPRGSAYE